MAKSYRGRTQLQVDAGRRGALRLSSQQVKSHFVAESLITTTFKDSQSDDTMTSVRARTRDQLEPELAAEEERRLLASLRQMHTNLAIARITRWP